MLEGGENQAEHYRMAYMQNLSFVHKILLNSQAE